MQNDTPSNTPPADETLLTMAEVMTMLNLSRTKVWTMIQKDELPAFKFGGDYRFRKSEIQQWMEKFRVQNINNKPSTQRKKK
ncbi:hypothetical protein FACS1894170_00420 [Planctomycetales bacterium]|nr:hypothetical protein FACS1894170_00420 [Planctomycetales bacterium]